MDHKRYWKNLADAGEKFTRDMRGAELQVLHDDGLYRHLVFRVHPLAQFELVTWPGVLTIRGSHGTYTLSRTNDMIAFFRESNGVNADYWAEKLTGGRDSAKEYSEEQTVRRIVQVYTEQGLQYNELLAKYQQDLKVWNATPRDQRYPWASRGIHEPVQPKPLADLRAEVADARADGYLSYEDGARQFLSHWESAGIVYDVGEWDMREYDCHFLWSCHAIKWGIAQYDAARTPAGPLVPAGSA